MQQLGRRAGALEIDLMSKQPGKQTNKLLSSLLGVVLEKRWKMLEGRAVQAVLISLLSTEARGANRYVRVFWIRCDVRGIFGMPRCRMPHGNIDNNGETFQHHRHLPIQHTPLSWVDWKKSHRQ